MVLSINPALKPHRGIIKNMLKFLLRFIKHLVLFLVVLLPLQLVGAVILLPVCYLYNNLPLPSLLRWFDGADQYVGRDTSVYDGVRKQGPWASYVWLAWRNPLNYFGYKVLGLDIQEIGETISDTPAWPVEIGDGTGQSPGLFHAEYIINGKVYYEYYYIFKYTQKLCLRFRMGHKLGHRVQLTKGRHVQFVGVISPFHSYDGI